MEQLKNFWELISSFGDITELTERRKRQLKKEAYVDKTLVKCRHHCPDMVNEYLMKSRELNRKLSSDLYNASMVEYADKSTEYLDTVSKTHENINDDYTCYKICSMHLPQAIKLMEDRLNRDSTDESHH
jgi:hypothetical protein